MRSALEIKKIVSVGGGVIVDASQYSTVDLKSIAANAKANVVLKNTDEMSTMDLRSIASAGKGHVIIDLTE